MSVCPTCGAPDVPQPKGTGYRRYCSDRCRRAQYDLECVVCGGRVYGGTPSRVPPEPVCRNCSGGHYTKWTEPVLVDAIRAYAERYGRPPGAWDWNPTMARSNGRPDLSVRFYADGCWPNAQTVQRVFGSWNAGIAAAGFEPMASGHRYNARRVAA